MGNLRRICQKLSWQNVLFSLHKNNQMFRLRVMQGYSMPDDESKMGIIDSFKLLLAPETMAQGTAASTNVEPTRQRAPVLNSKKLVTKLF